MKSKLFLSLFFLFTFFLASNQRIFAADCSLAKIEPDSGGQNWNVTYCATAATEAEARSITNVTATCRFAPGGTFNNLSCHEEWQNILYLNNPPVSSSQSISVNETTTDGSGGYLTCFTLTSLDRNMGVIDVDFKNSSGTNVCGTQRSNVTPGNYGGLLEYFQNTLATRNPIPSIIAVPTYNPSPDNQLYCEEVDGKKGINTALGCISYDASGGFIKDLLEIIIGLGGGIALLLILYGVFIVTTSAGIPEKLKEGNEVISSAIAGLLFIIMAIFLMNLIGIKILALPGLK